MADPNHYNYPQFFTATILKWKHLMSVDKYKDQTLNYIHNNPIEGKWSLASCPGEYTYSSAKFYETGIDDFGLLPHYYD